MVAKLARWSLQGSTTHSMPGILLTAYAAYMSAPVLGMSLRWLCCRYVNTQNQEEYECLSKLDADITLDLGTCGLQKVCMPLQFYHDRSCAARNPNHCCSASTQAAGSCTAVEGELSIAEQCFRLQQQESPSLGSCGGTASGEALQAAAYSSLRSSGLSKTVCCRLASSMCTGMAWTMCL